MCVTLKSLTNTRLFDTCRCPRVVNQFLIPILPHVLPFPLLRANPHGIRELPISASTPRGPKVVLGVEDGVRFSFRLGRRTPWTKWSFGTKIRMDQTALSGIPSSSRGSCKAGSRPVGQTNAWLARVLAPNASTQAWPPTVAAERVGKNPGIGIVGFVVFNITKSNGKPNTPCVSLVQAGVSDWDSKHNNGKYTNGPYRHGTLWEQSPPAQRLRWFTNRSPTPSKNTSRVSKEGFSKANVTRGHTSQANPRCFIGHHSHQKHLFRRSTKNPSPASAAITFSGRPMGYSDSEEEEDQEDQAPTKIDTAS